MTPSQIENQFCPLVAEGLIHQDDAFLTEGELRLYNGSKGPNDLNFANSFSVVLYQCMPTVFLLNALIKRCVLTRTHIGNIFMIVLKFFKLVKCQLMGKIISISTRRNV